MKDYDKETSTIRETANDQLRYGAIERIDHNKIMWLLSKIPLLLQANQNTIAEKYINGCYRLLGM